MSELLIKNAVVTFTLFPGSVLIFPASVEFISQYPAASKYAVEDLFSRLTPWLTVLPEIKIASNFIEFPLLTIIFSLYV